jgi:hypothetical protein
MLLGMKYPSFFQPLTLFTAGLVSTVLSPLSSSAAYSLEVSSSVAGSTPEVLAYNMGHMVPGSNSHDWFRYSEVNGFRVWSSPTHIEASDDTGNWGDGVDSWESFLERRQALRLRPLDHKYINWPVFDANFASVMTGTNRLSIKNVLEFSKKQNLTPLVMIHRGVGSFPFRDRGSEKDWASRWETWQHFYAQAFWLARHFDVERYQVYNEPDHRLNMRLPQEEYIERLKISSDAIQAALEDVNRIYGKELIPRISAPVTVAGITMFHARPDREHPDQRDSETGWGELVMRHRKDAKFPDAAEDFSNFQVYSYQQYGRDGPSFASQYSGVRELVKEANDGKALPVIITEFNVLANYMFRRTEDTMHTPSRAARLGSILLNLVQEQPDELYVFKFGQTQHADLGYPAKNGNFWQENFTAPYNTGGSTRGAEVYRLVMRTFHKGRQLLEQPQWTGEEPKLLWSSATYDPATEMYHMLLVNESDEPSRALQINFNNWNVGTPGLIIMEEVSRIRHGSVRGLVQLPENGIFNAEMPPESVWLLTIPKEAFRFAMSSATEDAFVQAGRTRSRNFGDERILRVSGHSSRANNRAASYIQFEPGDLPIETAKRILLRMHVRNTQDKEILPAHVYGLADTNWAENSITAENSPHLNLHGGSMREISDNRVSGQGEHTFILGTITAINQPQDVFIDVTDYVKKHALNTSFLITQENRFSGELSAYSGEMEIMGRKAGAQLAPQLIFLY